MKLTHWLAVAATAALVAACGSTTQGGAVGANRSQILIVSEAMMDEQAKLAYAETLQKASSARTLNINTAQTARVKNIASRLIAQTGHFRQDALRWDWQVNVIQEKTINAWCSAARAQQGAGVGQCAAEPWHFCHFASGRAGRRWLHRRQYGSQICAVAAVFAQPRNRGGFNGTGTDGARRLQPASCCECVAENERRQRRQRAAIHVHAPLARHAHC